MGLTRKMVFVALGVLAVVVVGSGLWLYTPDKPRAMLEAQYATPPSQFLDVAGVRLHVRDTGPKTAPALVLLHGFGASLHTWQPWAEALDKTYRVVRYDLPGFGLTGADPSGDYTDARGVAVLVALLDRLGIARATIGGNSMGGRIAWMFAAAHPERTEKLVLIDPDGFASPGRGYGAAPEIPLTARLLPYVLPMPMLRPMLAAAYAHPEAVMTDALAERYRDLMLAPGVRSAIVARMGQDVLVDPVPLLARITAPVLVMWGEQDAMIPFANADDYLRALPHATLAAFDGVGHLPQEEAPARSVQALRAFLDAPAANVAAPATPPAATAPVTSGAAGGLTVRLIPPVR